MKRRATFGYEGLGIQVTTGRQADVDWLIEFLTPWFELSDSAPDVEVLVRHDPALFDRLAAAPCAHERVNTFMLDTRPVDFPRCDAPEQQLVLHDEENRIFFLISGSRIQLVCGRGTKNLRTSLMRVVRELAMGVAQLRGGRFVHASAFVIHGQAVMIAGPRGVGKTSLLSYFLSNSQATFLANDRILVKPCGQQVRLVGMPTIVSIRAGTLQLLPAMLQSMKRRHFTARLTMAESRRAQSNVARPTRGGRWGLSPGQFCALLECNPQREATGAVLLLPRQTGRAGGLELRPLRASETRQQLANCLFGHIGPDRLSDAFTIMPARLPREPQPDDQHLFRTLTDSVAAFDCALGNDAYEDKSGMANLLQTLAIPQCSMALTAGTPVLP